MDRFTSVHDEVTDSESRSMQAQCTKVISIEFTFSELFSRLWLIDLSNTLGFFSNIRFLRLNKIQSKQLFR